MKIQENILLAQYTTFKIGGPARYFCAVKDEEELKNAVEFAKKNRLPILVIGGGSNLLVSDNGFSGMVIHMEIKGITFCEAQKDAKRKDGKSKDDPGTVFVTAYAGEDWENLVKMSVSRNLYGLENLSSIPGTVGASPVQNVGAYGSDVSNTIEIVRALDTETLQFVEFTNAQCGFEYRDSMFKRNKGRYIVSMVIFKLKKKGNLETGYKDVSEYFSSRNISNPTLEQVRQAVIEIRKNKLPDWTKWGTAGSFFKNPIISVERFEKLRKKYADLPGMPMPDGRIKVSLGWILDKICDAKGLVIGNVGTHEKQSLVIVAKPGATATDVLNFSKELMRRVKDKTGIEIEGEVEWAVA